MLSEERRGSLHEPSLLCSKHAWFPQRRRRLDHMRNVMGRRLLDGLRRFCVEDHILEELNGGGGRPVRACRAYWRTCTATPQGSTPRPPAGLAALPRAPGCTACTPRTWQRTEEGMIPGSRCCCRRPAPAVFHPPPAPRQRRLAYTAHLGKDALSSARSPC